jgi:cold shock CspA family protein
LIPLPGPHTGVVEAFDHARGLGSVVAATGERFGFHCTAIAGGSRDIALGAAVCFRVAPGALGHWEAYDLEVTAERA